METCIELPYVYLTAEEKKHCKIHIADFVEKELEFFRKECNFTDEELEYFNLRSKGNSNLYISMTMNVSEAKVNKLSRKVKDKMIRVL